MKATVQIDALLLERAKESLGIADAEQLVEFALKDAIHGKASERLAALGGTMPDLEYPARYRRGFEEE
ncbi:hypothetical protein SAMN05216456_2118 [Devosia crocina]|uniref:Antitoxin of type II TA system, VapB n=1 Tax=Devosia crocina TaxID=429728 RepID=A0A1I7NL41_9HYPH|nr:type II toxin-antitoxin system VapB family antitoxin [Devosia crocina]SFV35310.1 hypothetical protein SAMN05216456_2118 [Devosia crocina]